MRTEGPTFAERAAEAQYLDRDHRFVSTDCIDCGRETFGAYVRCIRCEEEERNRVILGPPPVRRSVPSFVADVLVTTMLAAIVGTAVFLGAAALFGVI